MNNLQFTARNYALDHANKIHSDETARKFGFTGALVPGVGIYSYLIAPAVATFGQQWLESGTSSVKFLKPVYDGSGVTVKSEMVNSSNLHLELYNEKGVLCAVGQAGSEPAPPMSDENYPFESLPQPESRRAPLATSLPVGSTLGSLDGTFNGETLGSHFDPSVRPAALLLGLANDIVAANVELGPWIHTASTVAHFSNLIEGESFSLRGFVTDSGKKRGHDYVVADLMLFGNSKRPIAAIRHSALIRLNPALTNDE